MPVLPTEALGNTPPYVLGIAVIRGVPTPVIDLGALVDGSPTTALGRFVTLRVGDRAAALAVSSVLSVTQIPRHVLHDLPPIAGEASADIIEALGTLDAELLVVMRASRIVPPDVWDAVTGVAVGSS